MYQHTFVCFGSLQAPPASAGGVFKQRLGSWSALMEYHSQHETDQEAYVGLHCFDREQALALRERQAGSIAGLAELPCSLPSVCIDIDCAGDMYAAARTTQEILHHIQTRYAVQAGLYVFYSGSKGYHIMLPTAGWLDAAPSTGTPALHRRLAEQLAGPAADRIDPSLYQAGRQWRLPNSLHVKTGLYKVHLEPEELLEDPGYHKDLAKEPRPYTWCSETIAGPALQSLGKRAQLADPAPIRTGERLRGHRLRRSTTEYLTSGARSGDRNRSLFEAAADIAGWNVHLLQLAGVTDHEAIARDTSARLEALLIDRAQSTGLSYQEVVRTLQSASNAATRRIDHDQA